MEHHHRHNHHHHHHNNHHHHRHHHHHHHSIHHPHEERFPQGEQEGEDPVRHPEGGAAEGPGQEDDDGPLDDGRGPGVRQGEGPNFHSREKVL